MKIKDYAIKVTSAALPNFAFVINSSISYEHALQTAREYLSMSSIPNAKLRFGYSTDSDMFIDEFDGRTAELVRQWRS